VKVVRRNAPTRAEGVSEGQTNQGDEVAVSILASEPFFFPQHGDGSVRGEWRRSREGEVEMEVMVDDDDRNKRKRDKTTGRGAGYMYKTC